MCTDMLPSSTDNCMHGLRQTLRRRAEHLLSMCRSVQWFAIVMSVGLCAPVEEHALLTMNTEAIYL